MGFSTGFLYLCLFGTYALAFWYGAVLIMEPDSGYSIGVVLTVFFSVIIGAFGIAQVKISNWVQIGRSHRMSLTTDCIRSYINLNGRNFRLERSTNFEPQSSGLQKWTVQGAKFRLLEAPDILGQSTSYKHNRPV